MTKLQDVFVYGTLRPGEGNHRWVRPAIEEEVDGCVTDGVLYFAGHAGFPYADFDATHSTITGTLLRMDKEHPAYNSMVKMEEGAGYEVRVVTVILPDGSNTKAIAFHSAQSDHTEPPYAEKVVKIGTGDWFKRESAVDQMRKEYSKR